MSNYWMTPQQEENEEREAREEKVLRLKSLHDRITRLSERNFGGAVTLGFHVYLLKEDLREILHALDDRIMNVTSGRVEGDTLLSLMDLENWNDE